MQLLFFISTSTFSTLSLLLLLLLATVVLLFSVFHSGWLPAASPMCLANVIKTLSVDIIVTISLHQEEVTRWQTNSFIHLYIFFVRKTNYFGMNETLDLCSWFNDFTMLRDTLCFYLFLLNCLSWKVWWSDATMKQKSKKKTRRKNKWQSIVILVYSSNVVNN